jgi:hypothetical protein
MPALAPYCELWAIPTAIADSARALVGGGPNLSSVHSNVIVPAFGLLV